MSSNLQSELDAIRYGAAFAPIADRAFLRITGTDATRWLNGMVTNSIQALQPGEGCYNFLLNAQGRIQGDCIIYREPVPAQSSFLLETGNSQLETVKQLLDKFIIMDDVELEQGLHVTGRAVETSPYGMMLIGPEASELLVKLITTRLTAHYEVKAFEEPPTGTVTPADFDGSQVLVIAPPIQTTPVFEVWSSRHVIKELYRILDFHKTIKLTPEALEAFRILSGTPRFGTDIRNTDLPQETNQPHALHFAKGCYLGQEIVERIRSRGQVHRLFTAFTLEGDLPTSLPIPLEANGKPAGEITSATRVPMSENEGGEAILALGYARREALDTKQVLTYASGTAVPRTLS